MRGDSFATLRNEGASVKVTVLFIHLFFSLTISVLYFHLNDNTLST